MSAVIRLPFPLPLNNLFVNAGKRGRVRSKRYDAWIAGAGWMLVQQHPQPVHGPFRFTMVLTRPDRRKRDLDGTAKCVMDLLVKHGVIDDDSECASIRLSWSDADPDPQAGVSLTVEPLEPQDDEALERA